MPEARFHGARGLLAAAEFSCAAAHGAQGSGGNPHRGGCSLGAPRLSARETQTWGVSIGEPTMKVLHALMWASGSVAVLAGLVGCRVSDCGHSRHGPLYVEQPQHVIVRQAPPPIVRERRPPPRSQGQAWIDGYWHWNGRWHVWETRPLGHPAARARRLGRMPLREAPARLPVHAGALATITAATAEKERAIPGQALRCLTGRAWPCGPTGGG